MGVDKRTRARELALQALYQLDVQGPELLEQLPEFFVEWEQKDSIRKLAWDWTKGTWDNLAECDQSIAACTIRWQFSRLSPVDKGILRLAVYQLRFCADIPPKVVMNEAIELAKKFSTDKSGSFVNGVLDAVARKLVAEDRRQKTGLTLNSVFLILYSGFDANHCGIKPERWGGKDHHGG